MGIEQLVHCIQQNHLEGVQTLLNKDPELAKGKLDLGEGMSVDVILYGYQPNRESFNLAKEDISKKIRTILLKHGADINFQNEQKETLGHAFSVAALKDISHPVLAYKSFFPLIEWIQDGGDISIPNQFNLTALKVIDLQNQAKLSDMGFDYSKVDAIRAILIGLDKRPVFPRLLANGIHDNPDEINFLQNAQFYIKKLETKPLNLKLAYKYDNPLFRTLRKMLKQAGVNLNVKTQKEPNHTLGRFLAQEAANRNAFKNYLRLIHWIRDGGNVDHKNSLGLDISETLDIQLMLYAENHPEKLDETYPGYSATKAILAKIRPDTEDDLAAKTDSRTNKYFPYIHKHAQIKGFNQVTFFDVHEEKVCENIILNILAKRSATLADFGTIDHLQARIYATSPCYTSSPNPLEISDQNPIFFEIPKIVPSDFPPLYKEQLPTFEIENNTNVIKHSMEQAVNHDPSFNNSLGIADEQKLQQSEAVLKLKELIGDLAEELVCPITLEILQDPVLAEDGKIYEKSALITWLEKNKISPWTRQPMSDNFRPVPLMIKNMLEKLTKFSNNG